MKTPISSLNKHFQLFIFTVVFLTSNALWSQETSNYTFNKTSLSSIISDIESKEGISFSFASDVMEGKTITLTENQLTLDELLDVFEAQTALVFKRVSQEQIIITPRVVNNEFCGYILDAQTKMPLPFVTVVSQEGTAVTTDEKGFYAFAKADKKIEQLSIQSQGYETLTVAPSENCTPLYLKPAEQQLGEVIITGYVTSGIDRNKDGSIDVTQKTLGILPGLVSPDILQSMQLVPGVGSLDESASGIQIRGGSPDQNLILFDDIKLFNSGYFYGMFSAFNPYATEKARIYKSGTSAEYGDRVSGIIDISTGDMIPEKSSYGVGMDGLSIDGYLKTKLTDKLGVYLFARRSYTDILQTPTYDGYAKKIFRNGGVVRDITGSILDIETDDDFDINSSTNEFSFYDLNAKVIFEPSSKDKIALSTLFTRNTLDFSFTSDGETKIDSLLSENNGASLNWKHKSSERSKQEFNTYFSNYKSYYNNIEIVASELEETNIRENSINDIGLGIKSFHKLSEKHTLGYGYQLSYSEVEIDIIKEEPSEPESNMFLKEKEENLKNAVFGEYVYRTGTSGIIGAGLRLVHYSSLNDLYVEPRLNVEQPLSEEFRLKASLERRHQPISQLIEFNQTELRLENNIWRLSDDTVYPLLRSDQFSAGFLFNRGGWTIDVDGYLKKLNGLTSFTSGFSTPQLELSEGESMIRGVDLLLKKRFDEYRIWIGYSFNDIDFTFPDIQSGSFRGNNDIKHSLRISNSLKINNFEFSLGWQYRSGEPFTPIQNFNAANSTVVFGAINSDRLDDYHRMDASMLYNFGLKKGKYWRGQLGFSLLNIYNRKIPISITYRTEEEDFGLELKQVIQRFSLGTTPNLSFRLFF